MLIHLGYLVENHQTHPFSLTLQDLTNLFVVGKRAHDIYYHLLVQLCDHHHIPVKVLRDNNIEEFEDQICECPLWYLNLQTELITFNLLDLESSADPFRQILILINLFENFAPLTPSARNLLHIIFWKTILSTPNPTFQYLQNTLTLHQHYNAAYHEIWRLLEALPHDLFESNYENISLSRIHRFPMIISGSRDPKIQFAMNLLLLKLCADQGAHPPPLFLVDPPALNSQLLEWLFVRYAAAKRPLVIFDSDEIISNPLPSQTYNCIITDSTENSGSPLRHQFTENELINLHLNNDQVAVRVRSEPVTRIINIF